MSDTEKDKQNLSDTITATLKEAGDLPQFPDDDTALERAQKEMLRVMDEMEKARERVGNYCVTIGKGDERIILLKKYHRNDCYSSHKGQEYYRAYICITKDGPRTLMIHDHGQDPWHYDDQFIADLDKAETSGAATLYPDGIFYNPHWDFGKETFEQFEARRKSVPGDIPKTLLESRSNTDSRFFSWGGGTEPLEVVQKIQESIKLVQQPVVQQHNDKLTTTQELSAAAASIRTTLGGTPPAK